MKKIYKQFTIMLCVFLCLSTCISALAAESLMVQGISDKTFNPESRKKVPTKWSLLFKENYPSVKLTMYPQTKNLTTAALMQAIKGNSFRQDVFTLDTVYHNAKEIMAEGYCVDLGQYESLTQILSQIHPSIVDAASFNGKIYGMPISITPLHYFSYNSYWWKAAGFTEEDVPTSFTGFLDFLDDWVERIKAQQVDNICISTIFDIETYNENSYIDWLTNLLNTNYARQCEYQSVDPDFNSPIYSTLLERIKTIGGLLYQYDKVETGSELFTERVGMDSALNQFVPLRMTDDDPIFLRTKIQMLSISSSCKNPELAAGFIANYMADMMNHPIEDLTKQVEEDSAISLAYATLFSVATEAVPGANFGFADLYRGWIERDRAALADEATDPKIRKRYEKDLPVLEYELEMILNGGEYIFSAEQLVVYQKELVPALYFPNPD